MILAEQERLYTVTGQDFPPAIKNIIKAVHASVTACPKSGCGKITAVARPTMHKNGRYPYLNEVMRYSFFSMK